jgi:hypothetical protein
MRDPAVPDGWDQVTPTWVTTAASDDAIDDLERQTQ